MKRLFALLMIAVSASNFYVMPAKADDCPPGEWLIWDDYWMQYVCVPIGCWINPITHDIECNPR